MPSTSTGGRARKPSPPPGSDPRRDPRALAATLTALAGCWTPPEPPPGGDGGVAAAAPSVEVRDARGAPWPLDATPRRPRLAVRGGEATDAFAGAPTPGERDALARGRVPAAVEARRIALVHHHPARDVTLARPLGPGEPWAVVVTGLDGDRRVVALQASDAGGARVVDAWPADGTAGVPPGVTFLALRFDGPVEGHPALVARGPDGAPIPGSVGPVDCADVGWAGGDCAALVPGRPLPPGPLEVTPGPTVVDATGAALEPTAVRLRVADEAPSAAPPIFLGLPCALHERADDAGCLAATDRSLTWRVRLDGPARLFLVDDGGRRVAAAVAARGEALLRVEGLAPGARFEGAVVAHGLGGENRRVPVAAATHADLAPVSIVEVRADALGPEPAQEYVELLNQGPTPVDLAGFRLTDDPFREGDRIPGPARLPGGGRALVVGDAFDPEDPADPPVPGGVPLFRVDGTLGSGGLANGGEPLWLVDSLGRPVSAAPGSPAPGPGHCLVRVAPDPRTGDAGAFRPDAAGGCTPGAPER